MRASPISRRAAVWMVGNVISRPNSFVSNGLRWLARAAGAVALAIALATAALMLWAHLGGAGVVQPLGSLWFAADAASLNTTQVVIERYLWPPLWGRIVFPVLVTPAPLVALLSALLAVVLLWLSRGRRSSA